MEELEALVQQYKYQFMTKFAMYAMFPSKIPYTVDARIQRWLVECQYAQDQSEVYDRILEFKEIIDNVVNNRLHFTLSSSFTMIEGGKN
eukprot:3302133-Ditylum_brightwellii.AAC.1